MNALFVVPYDYEKVGGMYLPINNYIEQLKKRGINCRLFLLPYKIKKNDNYECEFNKLLKTEKFEAIMVYGLNQCFFVQKWLKKVAFKGKRLALLMDCLVLEMVSVSRYTKFGKHKMMLWAKRFLYKYKEGICLKTFEKIVYVSDVDVEYVKKIYKKIVGDVVCVPNGTEIPNIEQKQSTNNNIKLGCLTGFSNETIENNLLPLVDYIFPAINKKYPDVKLVLAGRGCPDSIKNYLESKQNIEFLGFIDDLSDFYGNVDVIITTVKKESGILNRVLEAWAYRKTVLGFLKNFAPFSEAVDGVHFLSADTETEFVDRIGEIWADKNILNTVSENAFRLVSEEYSWDKCGDKLSVLLNK